MPELSSRVRIIIMGKRSSRDLLSNLPLGIIYTILEHVPIRDAVKTSLLARQWRYKWVNLPHLVFNDYCETKSENLSVKDFITQVLFLHKGPIHKFELDVPLFDSSLNIDQWLLFLSRNGIKMLILNFYNDNYLQVHSSLYSCPNLTHLELFQCDLPLPPPFFKGFFCLRRLIFQDVDVSSYTINSLLANSTLLEEIKIENTGSDLQLRIRAPNLKILYLSGTFKDISLYAPLLSKMSVICLGDLAQPKSSMCTYTEFLGGFTSLEELNGSLYFFKYLSTGIGSCRASLVFPHLRFIELTSDAFYDDKVLWVVARLSMDAPNLHKIKISLESKAGDLSFLDSEYPFNITFDRLKVIEIGYVGSEFHWMKLIKFLLASSPMLEKMICEPQSLDDSDLLKLATKLLKYPRASSNAKILFNRRSFHSTLWDSECAPDFTFQRLKAIVMNNVRGQLQVLKCIRLLLVRSPVLETFICKPNPNLPDHDILNLMAELLRFRRASTNCEILFGNKKRKRSSSSVQV
ncbi:hypothetical protein V2J09_020044 [Rumex salicifolius]